MPTWFAVNIHLSHVPLSSHIWQSLSTYNSHLTHPFLYLQYKSSLLFGCRHSASALEIIIYSTPVSSSRRIAALPHKIFLFYFKLSSNDRWPWGFLHISANNNDARYGPNSRYEAATGANGGTLPATKYEILVRKTVDGLITHTYQKGKGAE